MKTEQSFWNEYERRKAVGEKTDVHTFRVSYFTGKPEAEVTREERNLAKQANFWYLYSADRLHP